MITIFILDFNDNEKYIDCKHLTHCPDGTLVLTMDDGSEVRLKRCEWRSYGVWQSIK